MLFSTLKPAGSMTQMDSIIPKIQANTAIQHGMGGGREPLLCPEISCFVPFYPQVITPVSSLLRLTETARWIYQLSTGLWIVAKPAASRNK